MDAPVYKWLKDNIHPGEVEGREVLEVGSLDVNGSIRGHVQSMGPRKYVGVDLFPGPGVDCLMSADQLTEWTGPECFDAVISTEMLEHVLDWQNALLNMKEVLKPGGVLILTTRRPGFPLHCHPDDHWRFTAAFLRWATRDMYSHVVQDVAGKGVVLRCIKPAGWRPCDNSGRQPVKAPSRSWGRLRHRAWVKVAYRMRDPACPV